MKKGYTLIELLAVVGLIGLLLSITAISYNTVLKQTRNDAYKRQVSTIIQVGKDWVLNNYGSLSKETRNILFLEELLEQNYLNVEEIINPKTEKPMEGCIIIIWNESYQQYMYTYEEENNLCTEY